MKLEYPKTLQLTVAAVIVLITLPTAEAVPTMRISDGLGNSVTLPDNGAAVIVGAGTQLLGMDNSGALGAVIFNGTVGGWTLNVNTGLTKPFTGSSTNPVMDIHFVATGGTGTLTVEWSETGFGPYSGALVATVGGTTQGTVTYNTLAGVGNTLFVGGGLTASGPLATPVFGSTQSALAPGASPYSLTQVVTITHTASTDISSGDAHLRVPEGGFTLSLLGGSMVGLALLRRRIVKA